MKYIKHVVFFLMLWVAACGFHLKGVGTVVDALPYQRWQLLNTAQMTEDLSRVLLRWPQTVLEDGEDSATLKVVDIHQQKDIQSINRSGGVGEYVLFLHVRAQVLFRGKVVADNITVTAQRDYGYSDEDIYGKQEEEARLWREMRRDAAEQMVRRLAALPKP